MFVKILYQTFPNSLRVLSALSGFFLLTAEIAEHAKIFVTVFNTKLLPIILCVLSVLRGFILLTAEYVETFVMGFNSKLLHSTHGITVFLFLLCSDRSSGKFQIPDNCGEASAVPSQALFDGSLRQGRYQSFLLVYRYVRVIIIFTY